jgi:hypothetical protein
MTGISKEVVFTVSRIRTTFVNDIGNPPRMGSGTGVFLRGRSGKLAFVTNRHNVDPSMKLGAGWALQDVDLLVRLHEAGAPVQETKWARLAMNRTRVLVADAGDVAALADLESVGPLGNFGYKALNVKLATDESFARDTQIMDPISFIGYPGLAGQPWWDEKWETPIARTATIASDPAIPFTNSSVYASDVTLVAGLSFSGSSGSPVFTHAKPGVVGAEPPMLVGIMSGHLLDDPSSSHPMRHSGLSYYTRATSIAKVLDLV